jgi:hypothetical protein
VQLGSPVVFTGATSTTAGLAGYVPAPAAGDEGKFLRGDGTWANVTSGLSSIEDGITPAVGFTAGEVLHVSADGTKVGSSGVVISGNQIVANPSVPTVPNFTVSGQTGSGLWVNASGAVGITTGGVLAITVDESQNVIAEKNVTIKGDLDVKGTITYIESATMQITDNNIELGVTTSPTDITANGGGITLRGTIDKTIIYDSLTSEWQFNQYVSARGVAGTDGEVRIYNGTNTNFTGFTAPAGLATNVTYELPAAQGSAGQVLTNNGSGVLTWTTVSGGAGTGVLKVGPFQFNSLSPITAVELEVGQVINRIEAVVSAPFNGAGAQVTVGTDLTPDLILSDSDIDLLNAGTYLVYPTWVASSPTTIKVFITPGTLATTGEVYFLFSIGG